VQTYKTAIILEIRARYVRPTVGQTVSDVFDLLILANESVKLAPALALIQTVTTVSPVGGWAVARPDAHLL